MKKILMSGCMAAIILSLVLSIGAFAANGIAITQQPTDIAAPIGKTGTATVVATAEGDIRYQWYFKAVNSTVWKASGMTGAKTATISVPVTKARLGQQYKCVLTANGETVESNVIAVTKAAASKLSIDAQPMDIVARLGQRGTATVLASADTGAELSYQWYFKKPTAASWSVSTMTGAKTESIVVPVTKARIGQQYKCVITTADGGRIESDVVAVVERQPSVITIEAQPDHLYADIGKKGTATVEAFADTGAALSYQWYFKKAAATSWSVSGMSGAKTATITVPVTKARLGQQYKCVITTADGGKTESDVVEICEKPDLNLTVTRNPDSYRTLRGEPVQLDVSVSLDTDAYPVRYQWYKDGEKVKGATESSLSFTAVTPEDAGAYYCVVSGYGYSATSKNGTVKVSG